uniref:Uncharacterized protein n=1 Tax=Meloidogyne incognita TaxID=6306 RepID=A0A914NNX0_MELIC
MHSSQQNMNQYFFPQHFTAFSSPMINFPTNNHQQGQMHIQNYGVPNFFFGCPTAFSQQMMYSPYPLIPPQPTTQLEQNVNFVNENFLQSNIEKLLLETIADLNGTENNFEIKKFFKKFDAYLEDWPEKKKIFTLKSKLFGKAKSCFILAIKSKHYNYKSIKNFILCQLIPSEYKVEEPIDPIKKKTTNSNLGHLEKNFEKKENLMSKIQKPAQYKINIPFENVSYPSEVLKFFESPEETKPSKVEKELNLVKEMKISSPTNLKIKKTIKSEIKKKSFVLDIEKETDFKLPMNLFEDKKEFELVAELKNSVATNLPKKTIKKEGREKNLVLVFENKTDLDLPMNLFEAKEEDDFELPMNLFEKDEVKFKESEKEHVEAETIEEIVFENMVQIAEEDEPVDEDFEEVRKEKANELGRMKINLDFCNQEDSLEIRMNNVENFEKNLDPVIEENFKEKRKEKANELSRMKIDYESSDKDFLEIIRKDFENVGKESVLLKEFIGKESFAEVGNLIVSSDQKFKVLKLSKTRKKRLPLVKEKKIWKKSIKKNEKIKKVGNFKKNFKLNGLKQLEEYSFSEKYFVLKRINSKMKLLKISVLNKINAKMKRKGKRQEKFGWKKRKIKGRFFHGVRRRLPLKDMITLIRASNQFPNFIRVKRRLMQILKPKEDLQSVPETKQVIQTFQMAMLFIDLARIPIKIRKFKPVSATWVFEGISDTISEMFQLTFTFGLLSPPQAFRNSFAQSNFKKSDVEDAVI